MKPSSFLEAVLPDAPPVILGVRLRPFTAGHRLLLERHVVFDGSAGQLALAVLICSQNHADALADLQSRELPKMMQDYGERLRWTGRWPFRRRRVLDLVSEYRAFAAYQEQACQPPPIRFLRPKATGDVSEAPAVLTVWISLRSALTWEAFLDRPWALCLWETAGLAERHGHVRIVDPETAPPLPTQAEADAFAEMVRAREAAKEGPHGLS